MNKATIAGGTAAIVLIVLALVAGYRALEQDVDPAAATSPAITPSTAAAAEAPAESSPSYPEALRPEPCPSPSASLARPLGERR